MAQNAYKPGSVRAVVVVVVYTVQNGFSNSVFGTALGCDESRPIRPSGFRDSKYGCIDTVSGTPISTAFSHSSESLDEPGAPSTKIEEFCQTSSKATLNLKAVFLAEFLHCIEKPVPILVKKCPLPVNARSTVRAHHGPDRHSLPLT